MPWTLADCFVDDSSRFELAEFGFPVLSGLFAVVDLFDSRLLLSDSDRSVASGGRLDWSFASDDLFLSADCFEGTDDCLGLSLGAGFFWAESSPTREVRLGRFRPNQSLSLGCATTYAIRIATIMMAHFVGINRRELIAASWRCRCVIRFGFVEYVNYWVSVFGCSIGTGRVRQHIGGFETPCLPQSQRCLRGLFSTA